MFTNPYMLATVLLGFDFHNPPALHDTEDFQTKKCNALRCLLRRCKLQLYEQLAALAGLTSWTRFAGFGKILALECISSAERLLLIVHTGDQVRAQGACRFRGS